MHSKKTVLIVDLMNAANMELIRLDFRSSALSRHDKEFRRFCNYCTENGIQTYDAETGPRYFRSRFGLNIGDANIKLNRQQLDARNSIRFLDDIFQFGYALRYGNSWIHAQFRQILRIAKIPYNGSGNGPRPHDIRHTFAVHCLNNWVLSGEDITAALPVLSRYLGHNGLSGTQKYLQLTAQMYPDIVTNLELQFGALIPQMEVANENI